MDKLEYEIEKYATKIGEKKAKKLAFVITGLGMELFRVSQTPGASKILHSIYVPYSHEESVKFIERNVGKELSSVFLKKAVSCESASALCEAGLKQWPDCHVLAITGAGTTGRYRRGKNEAYIAFGKNEDDTQKIKNFYFELPKVSEQHHDEILISLKRREEDMAVAKFGLELVFNES